MIQFSCRFVFEYFCQISSKLIFIIRVFEYDRASLILAVSEVGVVMEERTQRKRKGRK